MDLKLTEGITYLIVPDSEAHDAMAVQVVISQAEARTMVLMRGGLCLKNWLHLRGLTADPVAES